MGDKMARPRRKTLPGAAKYISWKTGLKQCDRCGKPIGFHQSRAGKWYACDVTPSQRDCFDLYVLQPWNPHHCQVKQ
jgi:ssDNA-binding Zn-finger/Zn-ribbon topoisomerase 1